jgi:peptide/nickel transport system substrate-binding protein
VRYAVDLCAPILPPDRRTSAHLVGHPRWQNAEYDAIVEQIAPLSADDPQAMELFKQAMDIWVSEMPDIYVGQLIIRYPMSTQYWTNWPTEGNVYGSPHSWQHDFMLSFINLQPAQ